MNLILTSCLNCYTKNENGERIAHKIGNENGILDLIKKLTPKPDNFVYVASTQDDFISTDVYALPVIDSFKMTFPFKNYTILDGRTIDRAREIIENADLIYLAGGHVPTQNAFFKNINLKSLLKNVDVLILGESAGSMNAADIVYAQPELEGETVDTEYKRYINGLGLTKISILPHFEERIDYVLDGLNILRDISLPDCKLRPFIACGDGSYIYDNGEKQFVYGRAYLFAKGKYKKISKDNSIKNITKLVDKLYLKEDNIIME